LRPTQTLGPRVTGLKDRTPRGTPKFGAVKARLFEKIHPSLARLF